MFLTREEIEPEKEALVDDSGARVLYGDLRMDCERFENAIKERQLFLILADSSTQTIRFYYACMASKMVALLINPESAPEYIDNYIQTYHPQYIFAPLAMENAPDMGERVYETQSHALYRTCYEKFPMDEKLALLLTTSGSTGNPKTVRLSDTNLYDNAMAFVDAIKLNPEDRGMLTLPIFYTYGLAILHMHFFVGGTLLISTKKHFDPLLEEFMVREQVTNWHGVPYVYETFQKVGLFERIPPTLRLLTMGGGRAEVNLHEQMNAVFLKKGIRVYAMYGQTEGTCILTKVPDWEPVNPPGCIGVASLGMEAVIDPESGELCFRGSSVCLGYALDYQDLEKGDENNGFLRTGDLAEIRPDGIIALTGRISRIAKLRGIRIFLDDIEKDIEKLIQSPVACVDDDGTLQIFVEKECDSEAVKDWIAGQYHVRKSLLKVHKLEKLPRTSVGKLNYHTLEAFGKNQN